MPKALRMPRNIKEKEGHHLAPESLTVDLPMCKQTRKKTKTKKQLKGTPPYPRLPLEFEWLDEPLSLGVPGSIETCDLIATIHSCWSSSAAEARFFGSRMKHFLRKSIPSGLS
jgi:hypothetical protein